MTFVLDILLYLASLKLSMVAGWGWTKNPIVMKTKLSVQAGYGLWTSIKGLSMPTMEIIWMRRLKKKVENEGTDIF